MEAVGYGYDNCNDNCGLVARNRWNDSLSSIMSYKAGKKVEQSC